MRLEFTLPVPLNEGCKLKVSFPRAYYDISLSDPALETVTVQIEYGSSSSAVAYTTSGDLVIDGTNNLFTIDDVCEGYVDDAGERYIDLSSLLQPSSVVTIEGIQVDITTESDEVIISSTGFSFTPKPGSISLSASAEDSTVQTDTDITLTLTP